MVYSSTQWNASSVKIVSVLIVCKSGWSNLANALLNAKKKILEQNLTRSSEICYQNCKLNAETKIKVVQKFWITTSWKFMKITSANLTPSLVLRLPMAVDID